MILRTIRTLVALGLAALAGLALSTTGCSVLKAKSDPTRFYVLRPAPADSAAAGPSGAAPKEIRVGPGTIPGYLQNSPIVLEEGANRLKYLDLDHWAQPLPKSIGRTLGENLTRRLRLSAITLYPDPVTAPSSDEVRYSINRFEGTLEGPVTLDVSWQIFRRPANQVVVSKRSVYVVSPGDQPGGVAAYVDRLSRAVGRWADDVAAEMPPP